VEEIGGSGWLDCVVPLDKARELRREAPMTVVLSGEIDEVMPLW
jgi:hypothetical protein